MCKEGTSTEGATHSQLPSALLEQIRAGCPVRNTATPEIGTHLPPALLEQIRASPSPLAQRNSAPTRTSTPINSETTKLPPSLLQQIHAGTHLVRRMNLPASKRLPFALIRQIQNGSAQNVQLSSNKQLPVTLLEEIRAQKLPTTSSDPQPSPLPQEEAPSHEEGFTADCEICGSHGVKIAEMCFCYSGACQDCWDTYLRNEVMMSSKFLKCMFCNHPMQEDALAKTFSRNAELERKHKYFQKIAEDPNNRECPKCFEVFVGTPSNPAMECVCGHHFCFHHSDAHGSSPCGKFGKESLSTRLASNIRKRMKTKRCPSCSVLIEKNGGCPHMHCRKCGADYCWYCLKKPGGGMHSPLHTVYKNKGLVTAGVVFSPLLIAAGATVLSAGIVCAPFYFAVKKYRSHHRARSNADRRRRAQAVTAALRAANRAENGPCAHYYTDSGSGRCLFCSAAPPTQPELEDEGSPRPPSPTPSIII